MIKSRRLPRRSGLPLRSRRREPVALTWSVDGCKHRITAGPDGRIERRIANRWVACEPSAEALMATALSLTANAWRTFLEYTPARERAFVERFVYGRAAAWWVARRCPNLLADLEETPALTTFVAAHAQLRGTPGETWSELEAVHERGGVYGLLEWLGLPAVPSTLAVLRNLVDPDIPHRLLEPLRTSLWNPVAAAALRGAQPLSDRALAWYCHALAA